MTDFRALCSELTDALADYDDSQLYHEAPALIARARAALAKGADVTRPIPVAERLPTQADCDAEGRCWFWVWDSYIPRWELDDRTHGINVTKTAWIPAAAIPLPEASP